MATLEELEANPPDSRLSRDFTVVLDADLVRRVANLVAQASEKEQTNRTADKIAYRRLQDELESLQPQVEAASGVLTIRASITQGEWTTFIDKHPTRVEGQPGHDRDKEHAFGVVDLDALIEHLDLFAHAWDGESLAPTVRDAEGNVTTKGQFDRLLRDNIPPADLVKMATTVVLMYEVSPDFAGWRSALSSGLQKLRDFVEPVTSESPRSDSPDGNPEPSSVDATETATPAH